MTFAPLAWIIDDLPFIASSNSLQLYNWQYLISPINVWQYLYCAYCNKYFSSGDIVHTECTDPEPLHCRHSADSIQHAPHFHRTKQALLGELLHRIGKKQQLLTLEISCLWYSSLIVHNYSNRISCVSWRVAHKQPLHLSHLFLWFLSHMTDIGK